MSLFHTTITYIRAAEPDTVRTLICELDSPVWPSMPGYTALLYSFLVGLTRAERVSRIVTVGAVRLDMAPDGVWGLMRAPVLDDHDRDPSSTRSFDEWCGGRRCSRFSMSYAIGDVLDAHGPNVFADVRPLTSLGAPLDAWVGSLQAAAPTRIDAGEVVWAAYIRRFARTTRLLRIGDAMAGGTLTMHTLMPYNVVHSFDEAALAHARYATMLRVTLMAPLGASLLLVDPGEGPLSRIRSATLLARSWARWRGVDPSLPPMPDGCILDRLWGGGRRLGGHHLGLGDGRIPPSQMDQVWSDTCDLDPCGPVALRVLGCRPVDWSV